MSPSGDVQTFRSAVAADSLANNPPSAPGAAAGWYQWSDRQRRDFVTTCQGNARLPGDLVDFFRNVIADHSLSATIRNNMANCLTGQEYKDPALAAVFQRMMDDAKEDPVWRDYSLQFLAVSLAWSSDPHVMVRSIASVAQRESGSIRGTALLHLHYLEQQGIAALPAWYESDIATLSSDASANLPTRVTALAIIGERHFQTCAPTLRTLVRAAPEPAVRRGAVAALGLCGDASDRTFIQHYLNDRDDLVALAAQGALRNLAERSLSTDHSSSIH